MAFDNTLPTNTTKIRDIGTEIRPNWVAMEQNEGLGTGSFNQWVVHLLDRSTEAGASNTPSRLDDVGMVYCRNDGTANELYFQDSATSANEIQLSTAGKLGNTATELELESFSFDGTKTFNENNIVAASGVVALAGTSFDFEYNLASVTRPSTGVYAVVTDAIFASANATVTATAYTLAGNSITCHVDSISLAANALTITIRIRNHSANDTNGKFAISITGGLV